MVHEYITNTEAFADKLSVMLHDLKIEEGCRDLEIDHICLRLQDPMHVSRVRDELGNMGKEISCESVNGRDIMIFQLDEPLEVQRWKIWD